MSTYREELCNKDERGNFLFSPLCKPGRTVDTNLTKQVQTRSTYGDMNCYIPPVMYPQEKQSLFSDQKSANDWFKDPTYAQRAAIKSSGLEEDTIATNPSLRLYHTEKTLERVALSLMQTL